MDDPRTQELQTLAEEHDRRQRLALRIVRALLVASMALATFLVADDLYWGREREVARTGRVALLSPLVAIDAQARASTAEEVGPDQVEAWRKARTLNLTVAGLIALLAVLTALGSRSALLAAQLLYGLDALVLMARGDPGASAAHAFLLVLTTTWVLKRILPLNRFS